MNKRERIEESARILFLEKGIEKTSVREITERANVAKGTFYLYFEDKNALINHLMCSYLSNIINQALISAVNDRSEHSWIYCFFNAVINICETETDILRFMEQNIGSQEIKEGIVHAKADDKRIQKNAVIEKLVKDGYDRQDAMIRMVLAMHFTLSACYGSIVLKQPASLEILRPYILRTVNQIFSGGESDGNI